MPQPSVEFLSACIVDALLDYYEVRNPPVPVHVFLRSPPPDLLRDLSLTEALPFGEALWVRLPGGQGSVFVNPSLSEPQRRYAMAYALFIGLCASGGGQAAGLPPVPNDILHLQGAEFSRHLLMPDRLLPSDWRQMPSDRLAALFHVPLHVAQSRQREVLDA